MCKILRDFFLSWLKAGDILDLSWDKQLKNYLLSEGLKETKQIAFELFQALYPI